MSWVVGRGHGSWVWMWVFNVVGKKSIEKMIKSKVIEKNVKVMKRKSPTP